ncbi:hypothetical protein BH23ACT12_BH23ACT12_20480 [soil metagenome]
MVALVETEVPVRCRWCNRPNHVFLEVSTTICAYSLRAKDTPTVSTPITWDEVAATEKSKDPHDLRFPTPRRWSGWPSTVTCSHRYSPSSRRCRSFRKLRI